MGRSLSTARRLQTPSHNHTFPSDDSNSDSLFSSSASENQRLRTSRIRIRSPQVQFRPPPELSALFFARTTVYDARTSPLGDSRHSTGFSLVHRVRGLAQRARCVHCAWVNVFFLVFGVSPIAGDSLPILRQNWCLLGDFFSSHPPPCSHPSRLGILRPSWPSPEPLRCGSSPSCKRRSSRGRTNRR